MHQELIQALVNTPNEAADELLLEGLRIGSGAEQSVVLDALLARKTTRGMSGVIEMYDDLPEPLQLFILKEIKKLHHALRESGRSDRPEMRLAAMKLIALSRQGKLAYVLSENLHDPDDTLSKAAVEAMVALARWIATSTRKLQKEFGLSLETPKDEKEQLQQTPHEELLALYRDVMDQRGEIETAVARAMDVHRGKHTQDLLRATLLLCDWPQSKTLAILQTAKHGGQSPMVRRLQQPPASEHVEAFLLGGSHGQLRLHFGTVFSHINEAPVLDALLRKTHWLKDHQLQLCMHQVARGAWWQEGDLQHDIERRDPDDACKIAEWLSCSGMHDIMQDERMTTLAIHSKNHAAGRLRLLRVAIRRKRGSSVQFLRILLNDPDERFVRMAAREIVRRRPPDFENMLLQLMTNAPLSVRQVISRSIGRAGFDGFWQRFDRLDRPTRKQAGKAMIKMLPDSVARLSRRLSSGPIEQRLKAMQMTQELGLAEQLREPLAALATHPHPKVRSKVVSVMGDLASPGMDVLMERVLSDNDPRVRSNAIEVLEAKQATAFVPLLAQRARSNHNRERANAIKALHRMKVGSINPQLLAMLQDPRAEHRISAMWALKAMGFWKLLREVGRLAKEDDNVKVRRYAVGILKGVAEMVHAAKAKAG
jgi:HEAT repeat protein